MKIILILTSLCLLACSKESYKKNIDYDEDYVLIEFAAKLEEDYHRLNSGAKKVESQNKPHKNKDQK